MSKYGLIKVQTNGGGSSNIGFRFVLVVFAITFLQALPPIEQLPIPREYQGIVKALISAVIAALFMIKRTGSIPKQVPQGQEGISFGLQKANPKKARGFFSRLSLL